MRAWISSLPLFVLLMGIGSLAMLVPAMHAYSRADLATSRVFLYGTVLGAVLTLLIGIATGGRDGRGGTRTQLATLLAAFALLPVMFAVPFYEALRTTSFMNAWFEMVSSFTTTGATIYDNAGRLNASLHLWRALVGWMGGLLIWIAAVAVLAPMNLGGFEVRSVGRGTGGGAPGSTQRGADPRHRLIRHAVQLVPVYAGLTGALWVGLLIAGEVPIVAICHAMSVLATSGISPIGGMQYGASGVLGEALIFVFFVFALSRATFARGPQGEDRGSLIHDPELQIALALVVLIPALLFARHFLAATDAVGETDLRAALSALWGATFTITSFLTTTGFESFDWIGATDWSGLHTPGLILVGVALIGGGVATTAGGVKLLRVYALYKHGVREAERLVHPHSVGGAGSEARRIRRQGAQISWIFFMLFTVSITVLMGLLTLTGVQFETAMVLAVAALTTTGPLAEVAAENPILYSGIPDSAKVILAGAMVLGRLEALALIALLNPELWRS